MAKKHEEKKIARELEDFNEVSKVSKQKQRHVKLEILEKFLKR